jgi:glycosyltransferase involved in cell wall biosynthesis
VIGQTEGVLSVIMPLYNGAAFVAEAVQSVMAQLRPEDEIVIADDGSTDGGGDLAAAFSQVRVVRKVHTTIGDSVNQAIAAAKGDWLAFIDHDDRWRPQKRALQMAAFAADPTLALVFTHAANFTTVEENGAKKDIFSAPKPAMTRPSLMLRREAFDRVGPFSSDPQVDEFIAWFARAAQLGLRSCVLPQVLYERRIHGGNFTLTRTAQVHARYFHALKGALEQSAARRPPPP